MIHGSTPKPMTVVDERVPLVASRQSRVFGSAILDVPKSKRVNPSKFEYEYVHSKEGSSLWNVLSRRQNNMQTILKNADETTDKLLTRQKSDLFLALT